MSDPKWPSGWQEHRDDQIRWIAANTTPEQRIAWLEQTLQLFEKQILDGRQRRWDAEEPWAPKN